MSKTKVDDFGFSGGYNLLMLKVEEGNYDEVHRILTEIRNIDINSINKKGYTALALGVKAGHLEIVKLMISAGAEVNTKNNSGQNPLFLACWHNYEPIIQLLLDNGAEINSVDHRGWTPLMISAYHGHKQVVKDLINRNADTTIQDSFGKKAIDRAKDPLIIRMLQGDKSLLTVSSPRGKEKKPLPFSPTLSTEPKQKSHPLSILKKSSSKVSIGPSKVENIQNQSLLSPQSTSMSIQKSPSLNSTQKRLTEPRRNSGQFKNTIPKKEIQSAEKSTAVLKATLSEIISPIKASTNSNVKITQSPPSATFERQLFKDDMEKLVVDQMSHMAHKIQQIVERKVALEIPMQMQGYENQFKKQVESLLKFKAADIFKNLQAIFNLKLKFCLTRLGYDTGNLGLAPFFEHETNYVPEGLSFEKEPLKLYNEKEYKAIESDIDRLEKSILNQKAPTNLRGFPLENSSQFGHQCDHTSQVHRTEMKNDLLEQIGSEVRSTTEYLIDYSSTRVTDMAREESGLLYKRIMAEVADNMEVLEDELKDKFEEIISLKLNKVAEVLKSATGNEVSFDRVKSPEKQSTSNLKNYKGGFLNSSENKFRSPKYQTETESVNTRDERSVNDFNQDPLRESLYSETKGSGFGGRSQDLSQAKDKIQRIKNSLNFMDDDDDYDVRNERIIQDTAPNRQTDERVDYADEEEEIQAPTPEKEENEPTEELERGYNPTYRSSLTTETQYQISNRDHLSPGSKNFQQNAKSGKFSQPLQSRGTADSKVGSKKIPIPGHRIATNDKKAEQEMMKYYNFSNE